MAFASRGLKVCIHDINEKSVAIVLGQGNCPSRRTGRKLCCAKHWTTET